MGPHSCRSRLSLLLLAFTLVSYSLSLPITEDSVAKNVPGSRLSFVQDPLTSKAELKIIPEGTNYKNYPVTSLTYQQFVLPGALFPTATIGDEIFPLEVDQLNFKVQETPELDVLAQVIPLLPIASGEIEGAPESVAGSQILVLEEFPVLLVDSSAYPSSENSGDNRVIMPVKEVSVVDKELLGMHEDIEAEINNAMPEKVELEVHALPANEDIEAEVNNAVPEKVEVEVELAVHTLPAIEDIQSNSSKISTTLVSNIIAAAGNQITAISNGAQDIANWLHLPLFGFPATWFPPAPPKTPFDLTQSDTNNVQKPSVSIEEDMSDQLKGLRVSNYLNSELTAAAFPPSDAKKTLERLMTELLHEKLVQEMLEVQKPIELRRDGDATKIDISFLRTPVIPLFAESLILKNSPSSDEPFHIGNSASWAFPILPSVINEAGNAKLKDGTGTKQTAGAGKPNNNLPQPVSAGFFPDFQFTNPISLLTNSPIFRDPLALLNQHLRPIYQYLSSHVPSFSVDPFSVNRIANNEALVAADWISSFAYLQDQNDPLTRAIPLLRDAYLFPRNTEDITAEKVKWAELESFEQLKEVKRVVEVLGGSKIQNSNAEQEVRKASVASETVGNSEKSPSNSAGSSASGTRPGRPNKPRPQYGIQSSTKDSNQNPPAPDSVPAPEPHRPFAIPAFLLNPIEALGWYIPSFQWPSFSEMYNRVFRRNNTDDTNAASSSKIFKTFRFGIEFENCVENEPSENLRLSVEGTNSICQTDPSEGLPSTECNKFCNQHGFTNGTCFNGENCVCDMASDEGTFGLVFKRMADYEVQDVSRMEELDLEEKAVSPLHQRCSRCSCSEECQKRGAYIGYCGNTCYCGLPWQTGTITL